MSLGSAFGATIGRELRLAFRRLSDIATPLMFFAIVATLFPLGISPDTETLRILGPGVLWIAVLLAMLLSLNSLFRSDLEDGTLEQLALSPYPLAMLVFAKTVAHWIVAGLPLLLLAPLFAFAYDLPGGAVIVLVQSLTLGTPALSLAGSIGAALTAGLHQASGLLALLILPLMMPVLIFGARATDLAVLGEDATGPLYALAAISAFAASLAPLAAAAAVRVSLD